MRPGAAGPEEATLFPMVPPDRRWPRGWPPLTEGLQFARFDPSACIPAEVW